MKEEKIIRKWVWAANVWYPLMRKFICARAGHNWVWQYNFPPTCTRCKALKHDAPHVPVKEHRCPFCPPNPGVARRA